MHATLVCRVVSCGTRLPISLDGSAREMRFFQYRETSSPFSRLLHHQLSNANRSSSSRSNHARQDETHREVCSRNGEV